MLVSSHVLAEVAQTADQLVIIDRGRLVAQSTLAALVLGILVLGTGLAALLRNQVAALIVGLLRWSQGVEQILAGLLKQPGLERWLPMGAAAALTRPGDGTLPMWAGALVLAGYGLVLALLGGRLLVRRDLTRGRR